MEIPSLLDIFTIIVLIVPGFYSFSIVRGFTLSRRTKFSDLEITIFSLMYALPILMSYSLLTGISGIDAIRDSVFLPGNLVKLLGLAFFWGFVPGLISWLYLRKQYVRGDSWEEFGKKLGKGAYIIVYTESGHEYKGWIHFFTASEEKHELIIGEPKLILRDKNWNILNEIEMGYEMLLTEKNISRIVSLRSFDS